MHLAVGEKRPTRVVDWLNARLTLIFGLILAVFLLGFVVSLYAFNIQRQLDDQKVLLREDADGILRSMTDQESALQSYVSSNNPVFLESFRQARPVYLTFVQNLTAQLQSSAFRHTAVQLANVEEVADEWYSTYALAQINEMQAGKFADARSETRFLQGNFLFDQSRAAVTRLQEAIDQDLAAYQNQVDTINLGLVIGVIALLLGANAAFLRILRNLKETLHTQITCLTHTTQLLGQGERTARVEPLTFIDLDQVGQSINSMASAISQHEEAAEEAMHTLERQYALVERAQSESRAIFDASGEALLFISTDGEVHAVNQPFREFFGLTAEAVVGMPFADLQHQWEPLFANAGSFHADLIQDLTNRERRYTTTVTQQKPQYRELAVSSTPVQSSTNTYLGRLYVLRDITREREAERLKGKFYALVSHGLRTPLTSIKGYTDLLAEQEATGLLNDVQQEFVGIVQSNIRRLMALVNDLLDLSRMETKTLVIRKGPLNLHSLIRTVAQRMRSQTEERHQQLSLHLPDAPLMVLGDEHRVEQILTNLLTFATIHTPVGGRIEWETQQVDTMVRITCSSTAVFSAEDLAAFHRPFFLDSTLPTAETVGSMLGPSITRSLVELHGGTLEMKSEARKGSTITFTLPLAPS